MTLEIRTVCNSASAGAESSIAVVTNNSLTDNFTITISANLLEPWESGIPSEPRSAYGVSSAPMFPAPIPKQSASSLIAPAIAQWNEHLPPRPWLTSTLFLALITAFSTSQDSVIRLTSMLTLRSAEMEGSQVRKSLQERMTCRTGVIQLLHLIVPRSKACLASSI